MICPLMDLADPRCSAHLSLVNLSDAFSHCVGRYQSCPVYQRRVRDRLVGAANVASADTPAATRLAG